MEIFAEVAESTEFLTIYSKLKAESFDRIAKCFSNDYVDQDSLSFEEKAYLIRVASFFVNSPSDKHKSISARISNHIMESESTDENTRAACAYILNQLTISQSVDLAKKNKLVTDDIESRLPPLLQLDLVKSDLDHSFSFGKNAFPINSFQKKIVQSFNTDPSTFISGPTSAGKSFVLLRLLVAELTKSERKFSCIVVPTRALVKQVQEDLVNLIVKEKINGIYVTSVPRMPAEDFIKKRKTIFVFTQERLTWLLNNHTNNLAFHRLVVDEIHKIGDGARGLILESILRVLISTSPGMKTAFSGPNIESFDEFKSSMFTNLVAADAKSEMSYIPQNLFVVDSVEQEPKKITLGLYVDGKKVKQKELDHFSTAVKPNETASDIVWRITESAEGGSIIYVNVPSLAEKIAVEISSKIKPKNNDRVRALVKLIGSSVHKDYKLCSTVKKGVGFHYGNMPSIVREEIEGQFKSGEIKYLVCTSTLIEGVNLNAKNVFVLVPKRNSKNDLTEVDFWNLAGRAGRLGSVFEGNIVCLRNYTNWKFKVPYDKKKATIKMASKVTDKIIRNVIKKFNNAKVDSGLDGVYLDNLISYYFESYLDDENFVIEGVSDELVDELRLHFSMLMEVSTVPEKIYRRAFGINPCNILNLYEHFSENLPPMDEIIPLSFEDIDEAREKSFEPIIKTISKFLSREPEALAFINSKLVVDWTSGTPLPKIIARQIKYWTSRPKPKNKSKDAAIRDTLEKIESYVRFQFLKHSSCYFDVLKHVLIEKKRKDLADQIPELNLWLEFGTNTDLEILLMSLGLSRASALHLGQFFPSNETYDLETCVTHLKSLKIKELEATTRVEDDLKRVLEYLETLDIGS